MMIVDMEFYVRIFQTLGKITDPAGQSGIHQDKFRYLFQRNLFLAFEIKQS